MKIQSFADNPFLVGHDNPLFTPDERLGFVHQGGDFIGETGFVSFEQTVEEIQGKPQLPVVLNMGDSSTSGWESDSVSKAYASTLKSHDPFFQYQTYSDLMRVHELNVINAGVSGYSSLQGKIYLETLLRRFAKSGIGVDFVTLYFGNNDCVYSFTEDKASIEHMVASSEQVLCRVTVEDYRKNILSMIETTRAYGADPVVIIPVINLFWKPGLRSNKNLEEYSRGLEAIHDSTLQGELLEAESAYSRGRLYEAYTQDRFLPRIKPQYLKVLKQTARKLYVPFIDVQDHLPTEKDDSYFRDYCHPLEPINELIVARFNEIRLKKQSPQRSQEKKEVRGVTPNVYPLW
ncbi:MAG: GDSL-type esterase/lipase family protein [Nanoarchaeota archaeon]